MRVLHWMAACVLLVLLIIGVGSVMTFVIGGLVWTPWLTVFAVIVFSIWVRLAYR